MTTEQDMAHLIALRRDIHAHPELGFREIRTAELIARQLARWGVEVHTSIGGTGVVGVLRMGTGPNSVGLRADMDALPIQESTGLQYASQTDGTFHGCGHDGHVAMLLGAAEYLARHRPWDGTVNFIFQPAEEGLGGARRMIEDGLFKRFPCDRVFALHNWPALPAGVVASRPGPIMAAADRFEIVLEGRGGHAAMPHEADDLVGAASQLVLQLNTLVSRKVPTTASAVLSVTQIASGRTHNVLPSTARIGGTVRTFELAVQDTIERGVREMAEGIARANGVRSTVQYNRYYPATVNDSEAAREALDAAATIGPTALAPNPALTSEDFAFMLQVCKGAYIWLGQGSGAHQVPLHHPAYDFNDHIIGAGIRLHVALARSTLTRSRQPTGVEG